MASINGITIKSLKKFRGHEGEELFQGNVYFNNKKLGFWSQGDWGGPDTFDFNMTALNSACKDFQKGHPQNSKYYDILDDASVFMGELVNFIELTSRFKSYFKKGYKTIITLFGKNQTYWIASASDLTDNELFKKYSEQLSKARKEIFDLKEVTVFRENTFDLVIDEEHKAPPHMVR